MSHYRAAPRPLPSLRPVLRYDAFDFMLAQPDAYMDEQWDESTAMLDADHREKMARQAAREVPCPESSPWTFDGPAPRWYTIPPPTPALRHLATLVRE